MPDLLTMYALYQGGKAIGSHIAGNLHKQPAFKDTKYGKYLSRVSKEGIYTPKARGIVQAETNKQAGAVAQDARSTYQGQLISRGMDNSIAGLRGSNEIDNIRQREVAKVAREITLMNETSKIKAEKQYALGYDADRTKRIATENQSNKQLVDSLFSAVDPVVGKGLDKAMFSKAISDYKDGGGDPQTLFYDLYKQIGDKDVILEIMRQLAQE